MGRRGPGSRSAGSPKRQWSEGQLTGAEVYDIERWALATESNGSTHSASTITNVAVQHVLRLVQHVRALEARSTTVDRAEMGRLAAESADHREIIGLLLRDVKVQRDYACPKCFPEGGRNVDPNFTCAWHRAVEAVDGHGVAKA